MSFDMTEQVAITLIISTAVVTVFALVFGRRLRLRITHKSIDVETDAIEDRLD